MRSLLPVLLLLCYFNTTNAQNQLCDSLYFANGQVITAQVLEKSDSIIRYTVCGDSTRQQYEVKNGDVTFISPLKSIAGQSEKQLPESATQTAQKCYKNFLQGGFLPFFSELTKFHLGYARAITKHMALGVDYTYFDYKITKNDGFIFSTGSTVKRRTGYEFAFSGRFYFKSCPFSRFYLKPGASFSSFEGSKLIKSTYYNIFDPDNPDDPGFGVYTSTETKSAHVKLNSIFIASGLTVRTNRISLDLSAGIRKSYIKLLDIRNNYTYKSFPVFGNLSIGYAF